MTVQDKIEFGILHITKATNKPIILHSFNKMDIYPFQLLIYYLVEKQRIDIGLISEVMGIQLHRVYTAYNCMQRRLKRERANFDTRNSVKPIRVP